MSLLWVARLHSSVGLRLISDIKGGKFLQFAKVQSKKNKNSHLQSFTKNLCFGLDSPNTRMKFPMMEGK